MEYNKIRKKTREINIGSVAIGGINPIAVQSMTNTDTHNIEATVAQVKALANAGCDIVRIAVPDIEAADTVAIIKKRGITVPIVADIHFDYRIALRCAELGVDKIRINPGNIGDADKVRLVCEACKSRGISIRVGVNSGSLEKKLLEKYGSPTAQALFESAMGHIRLLEANDFHDIAVSVKTSDVKKMIDATRMLSDACDYPLHLGVTEAGGGEMGLIKGATGIGSLLCNGIGDTIRVSLTDDPICEVKAARDILTALNISGQCGMNIISCPTCGRTKIDLIRLAEEFKAEVSRRGLDRIPITVAIMGCAVNGPGEAREADIGIAGGNGEALLFSHGEIIGKLPQDKVVEALADRIGRIYNK